MVVLECVPCDAAESVQLAQFRVDVDSEFHIKA
jgi:hypothetical protein